MRRVDLSRALREPTQADLHAGSRRILALLDGAAATGVWEYELSVLKECAVLRAIGAENTEVTGPDWPVMEAFGAILFLINQGRAPERRSLHVGTGELGFSIDRHSGLLPPGMVSLRCICGLYPPPDMFAVLRILRDVRTPSGEARHFAGEPD